MNQRPHIRRGEECRVCLIPHHQPTHEATLRLRAWLRERHAGPAPEPVEGPLRIKAPAPADRPLNDRTRERRTKKARSRRGSGVPYKAISLTPEAILDELSAGRDCISIGQANGLCRSAVSARLNSAIKADPKIRARYEAMLVCGCKKRKQAHAKKCAICNKQEARAASSRRLSGKTEKEAISA